MTNLLMDKVAEAMFSSTHGFPAWDQITGDDRDLYRALARAAVEASLSPFAQWLCDTGYLADPQVLVARWLEFGAIVTPPVVTEGRRRSENSTEARRKTDPNPVVAETENMYCRADGTIYFKDTHTRIDLESEDIALLKRTADGHHCGGHAVRLVGQHGSHDESERQE